MKIDKKIFAVAPLLDWTDKHCRYFMRLMTKRAVLYTEMMTTGAILRGDARRHLDFNPEENPLVIQLGGSNPTDLAKCAKMAQKWGYDEINLNVGCPSSRVQSGSFGACLMKTPLLVADCVNAMQEAVDIPVTVKTRTGVDNNDSIDFLFDFIDKVSNAGCKTFIIHARKAWLKGLSPKENREIPPLQYDTVRQCQKQFPGLHFMLNGGIQNIGDAKLHLKEFDGVMLGRAVMHAPYLLSQVDEVFGMKNQPINTREEVIERYKIYIREEIKKNVPIRILLRPLMGLYFGTPSAKKWRKAIAENTVEI